MNEISTAVPAVTGEIKKKKSYTARESAFAFGAAALGFCFIKLTVAPLFMNLKLGLGASAFMLSTLIFYAVFGNKDVKNPRGRILRITLCALFSVNIFISANMLIQFLSLVFAALILIYGALADKDERLTKIRAFFPIDLTSAALFPFGGLGECPSAIRAAADKSSAWRNIRNAILGLAIAVPSTVVVGSLLMRADDGFERIMDSLLSDGLARAVVFIIQLLMGLPAGFYIYSLCLTDSRAASDDYCLGRMNAVRFLPSLAGVFSAVPLCVMYVVFFFSQISYFISAFMGQLPDGMNSYSDYARQGFFELCAVSVINLAVIIAINLFCRYREDGKRPVSIRAMTCVLCVFTLLLIATAVSKMVMYINVYGLTRLRFYTTWFMLLLAVIFAGIFIFMAKEKLNLWRFTVTAFTVMFAVLSLSCPDRLIAEYNINRYLNGSLSDIDIYMFQELSADAIPAAEKIYYKLSPDDREELDWHISRKLERAENGGLRGLTVSELIASGRSGNDA